MIISARDFVAERARLGESPNKRSAFAETSYRFPMIAVREIIANAIVHRDYQNQESSVQVHMFNDRIEVISPGNWGGSPEVIEAQTQLVNLDRPSQKRNFRLARTLTWSKLVEGVGAGVLRATADCRALSAPEPTVSATERMVVVTIYQVPQPENVLNVGDPSPVTTERITVALVPKAAMDLQRLQERTNLTKTDIVNRALTLYEFIDAQLRSGKDLLLRDPKTGESQSVLLL